MKKKTYAELAREIKELKSQMVHSYAFASQMIDKTSDKYMMASGVMLELTAIGGKKLIEPVMIKDGLSQETIEAIKADIKKSYDLTLMFKV